MTRQDVMLMAIEVGPQSSAGPGGIPTKYLIIGAGVLGVGALLLMQRRAPAASPDANFQPTGSTSAQLSSVQQLQLQQFGELTKLFAAQSDLIGTQIGGLSAHLDTQAGALGSSISGVSSQIGDVSGQLTGQGGALSALQGGQDALVAGTQAQFAATSNNFNTIGGMLWDLFQRASNPLWQPSSNTPNPFHIVLPENVAVGGA